MALSYKGSSVVVPEADAGTDHFAGRILWVRKITADVGAAAGTVKLREGGAAGNVIMDNVALLPANTQPVLLSFDNPSGQPIRNLYVETLTNADLVIHLA